MDEKKEKIKLQLAEIQTLDAEIERTRNYSTALTTIATIISVFLGRGLFCDWTLGWILFIIIYVVFFLTWLMIMKPNTFTRPTWETFSALNVEVAHNSIEDNTSKAIKSRNKAKRNVNLISKIQYWLAVCLFILMYAHLLVNNSDLPNYFTNLTLPYNIM